MAGSLFSGLSLIDTTGHAILLSILVCLALAVAANLFLRARYARLESDVARSGRLLRAFDHAVLTRIARDVDRARHGGAEVATQALVEDAVHAEMKPILLAERFARAAPGLVIILGLLGTFYGLTLSIGKLVHLVAADTTGVTDVAQALTTGLTQALSGMAVAFSNSLLGVGSAVVLTVLGIFSNVAERRVALMVQIEAYVERALAEEGGARSAVANEGARLERVVADFGASVERLEAAVGRFDSALGSFATSTRDFGELNAHLKDNVQRMSLSFGDFSDALKTELATLRRNGH